MRKVVDDCLALDSNRLARQGAFSGYHVATNVSWSGGSAISVIYSQGTLQLQYNMRDKPNNQEVDVLESACHFGGVRYYFSCPRCFRKVCKLRFASTGFYCRQCNQLPYYTQQCGHLDGLIHKHKKLQTTLNDSSKQTMRMNNRMRLTNQLCDVKDQINYAMMMQINPQMAQALKGAIK